MQLRPYQLEAAEFLARHERAMVLAPVGAGKTALTLSAIGDLLYQGHARRVLVLAPKRVAESVWPVEQRKWEPALRLEVAVGTPTRRAAAMASDAQVIVSNYDNLPWLASHPAFKTFDAVVFDELTRLKNPSGKRFKALEKALDHIDIRWGLTGSFTSNGLEDVFGQSKIIDKTLLGRSKGAFLQQYFFCLNRDYDEWKPLPGSLEKVMGRLRPVTYLLEPGVYADKLPPLNIVPVSCTLEDRAPYDAMRQHFMAQFPDAQALAASAAAVTNKLQQMACIAHDTPVLTDVGWLPIQQVTSAHRVWDGEAWVTHDGCIFKGVQPVVYCFNVRMTYNHKVLTVKGWKSCKDILNGDERGQFDRAKVRLPDGYLQSKRIKTWLCNVAVPLRMRGGNNSIEPVFTRSETQTPTKLWVSSRQYGAWDDRQSTVSDMEQHEKSLFSHIRQRLSKIRRRWHSRVRRVDAIVSKFLERYEVWVRRPFDFGSNRWIARLLQTELPLGHYARATEQPQRQRVVGYAKRTADHIASRAFVRSENRDASCSAVSVQMGYPPRANYARTYDLLNCGPRNRFVVKGSDGAALIVHNCGFVYVGEGQAAWFSHHKFDALDALLDENQRAPTLLVYNFIEELAELKRRYGDRLQTLDDERAIERWNGGGIELLAAHPKSAGHGLNLQAGGCHLVFLSLPWSLELYEQVIGRLHRSGQTKPVWAYVLMSEKTIDQKIMGALNDKRTVSDAAIEELR